MPLEDALAGLVAGQEFVLTSGPNPTLRLEEWESLADGLRRRGHPCTATAQGMMLGAEHERPRGLLVFELEGDGAVLRFEANTLKAVGWAPSSKEEMARFLEAAAPGVAVYVDETLEPGTWHEGRPRWWPKDVT